MFTIWIVNQPKAFNKGDDELRQLTFCSRHKKHFFEQATFCKGCWFYLGLGLPDTTIGFRNYRPT